MAELDRVCCKDGKIIIPTYMNRKTDGKTNSFANTVGKAGADFKWQFTFDSYKQFIEKACYKDVEYTLIDGKISCAVAVINKISCQKGTVE